MEKIRPAPCSSYAGEPSFLSWDPMLFCVCAGFTFYFSRKAWRLISLKKSSDITRTHQKWKLDPAFFFFLLHTFCLLAQWAMLPLTNSCCPQHRNGLIFSKAGFLRFEKLSKCKMAQWCWDSAVVPLFLRWKENLFYMPDPQCPLPLGCFFHTCKYRSNNS